MTEGELHRKLLEKDFRQRQQEDAALRKDIQKARGLITNVISRYKKERLRVRSVKAAEDNPFAELADYTSTDDILNAYGCEIISERKKYHLLDLWEMREQSLTKGQVYEDRITRMLDRARNLVGEEFSGDLDDFEEIEESVEALRRKG